MSKSDKNEFDFETVSIHSVYLDNFRKRKKQQLLKKGNEDESSSAHADAEKAHNKFSMKDHNDSSNAKQKAAEPTEKSINKMENSNEKKTSEKAKAIQKTVPTQPIPTAAASCGTRLVFVIPGSVFTSINQILPFLSMTKSLRE